MIDESVCECYVMVGIRNKRRAIRLVRKGGFQ